MYILPSYDFTLKDLQSTVDHKVVHANSVDSTVEVIHDVQEPIDTAIYLYIEQLTYSDKEVFKWIKIYI